MLRRKTSTVSQLKRGAFTFLSGKKDKATTEALLDLVTTVDIAGVTGLVAKEKFREGKITDGVRIIWLGTSFKGNFLSKKEASVAPAMLRIQKVKSFLYDMPILTALGNTAETTLSQFWELLKRSSGQEGSPLLVNGWDNVAYIRDKDESLSVINGVWRVDCKGWAIESHPPEYSRGWYRGSRVVSH